VQDINIYRTVTEGLEQIGVERYKGGDLPEFLINSYRLGRAEIMLVTLLNRMDAMCMDVEQEIRNLGLAPVLNTKETV
jgi:hypothetical protein